MPSSGSPDVRIIKMHIAINCRSFLSRHYTGIGRYAFNLVRSLTEIDENNRYSLYAAKGLFDFKRKIPRIRAKNFTVKVDRFKQGPQRILNGVDIYHAPSPELIRMSRAKIVVTVHDVICKAFPQGHTQQTLSLTDQQFASFLPAAARIICSSENTRRDLHKYFAVKSEKSCVIYQGIDHKVFYPCGPRELEQARQTLRVKGIEEPFILFVGTIEPRKNLKGLMEAFARLKNAKKFTGRLVVVGMMGWESGDLAGYIEKLDIKQDVIFSGYLTNDDLRSFYNLAEVFVFPSFYEGFGYPILEAFSCGAAVVASNASSCPELAGDAALLIDPNSPEDIAKAIEKVLGDSCLKDELKKKGLKRAETFDNLKTARETLRVYEEVYKG